MTDTPHNMVETLKACLAQSQHLDSASWGYGATWESDCQAFVHCMWGLRSGGFGSAYLQWLGLDDEDRHPTRDLSAAPFGATLFSKGSSPWGHTWIGARPFPDDTPGSWSTDMRRTGQVDKVARQAVATVWGHTILGWGTSINGYALDLSGQNPPKPKQNKRYERIQRAHDNLFKALEPMRATRSELRKALHTAQDHHDKRDINRIHHNLEVVHANIDALQAELLRLEDLYGKIRHA